MISKVFKFDVFICHASEDKVSFVDPLAHALQTAGIKVWYDRFVLDWGEDLRSFIDSGLRDCRFGIVVFSKAFLGKKKWTEYELNGLFARETPTEKLILPIWHGVTRGDFLKYSPTLADRLAKDSQNDSIEEIVYALKQKLSVPVFDKAPAEARSHTPQANTPAESANSNLKHFTAQLPPVSSILFGRERELQHLDEAWLNPSANCIQLIAPGGTGKTALVDKWFRKHLSNSHFFGWSFSSQGVAEERQSDSDDFFKQFFTFFGLTVPITATIYTKAAVAAEFLRSTKVLMVLDGLEPLQEAEGELKDKALFAFLQELATGHLGLVLCTTRLRVRGLFDDAPRVSSLELENLDPNFGAEYLAYLLRESKHHNRIEDLRAASIDFGSHALALTLLGSYTMRYLGGIIHRRNEIPALMVDYVEQGAHARRIMHAYAVKLAGRPELHILFALAFFDRPVDARVLRLVLVAGTSSLDFDGALAELRNIRLVSEESEAGLIDCHPLVREHFSDNLRRHDPERFRQGHAILCTHYLSSARELPASPQEMSPLLFAVYHGARSGQQLKMFNEVYKPRILRGNSFYLSGHLGMYATNVSQLANFFDRPFTEPSSVFRDEDRAWLLYQAGFSLRNSGRYTAAIAPLEAAALAYEKLGNYERACAVCGSLQGLHQFLGNLQRSVDSAKQGVLLADQSGDLKQRVDKRAALGESEHMVGNLSSARALYEEAEGMHREKHGRSACLTGAPGYTYCDFLLDTDCYLDAIERATSGLADAEARKDVRDRGLFQIVLGDALRRTSKEYAGHLDLGIECLRESGYEAHLIYGLLTRRKRTDLEVVLSMATRSGMRRALADCFLWLSDLDIREQRKDEALDYIRKAEALIEVIGYGRRRAQLAQLKAQCHFAL
ncbi:MAG TPA: toll/interleukin-1 receptor domain-containing protein [Candidatus Angelobacter sp.]|jgi:tetratricopeptide (TPR) repeat protein|nr:toll/interleukin-1 receptor domain-containing protein [Candidatus Angelobacter sp.]